MVTDLFQVGSQRQLTVPHLAFWAWETSGEQELRVSSRAYMYVRGHACMHVRACMCACVKGYPKAKGGGEKHDLFHVTEPLLCRITVMQAASLGSCH